MKTCTVCYIEKETSEFFARKASGDGLQSKCKTCQKKQDAAHYQRNKEKVKNRAKAWSDSHLEERKKIEAQYRKRNRQEQNLRTQNYRARRDSKSDGWNGGAAWWGRLVQSFEGRCAYCRGEGKLTVDHVVPLNKGGKHAPENIVPACGSCNYTKRDQSLDELGWTCFVPSSNVIRVEARKLMDQRPGLCFQRAIRETVAEHEGIPEGAPTSMAGAFVTVITPDQAAEVILKYEWLGTIGHPQACYGLWLPVKDTPTLAGVVCFGLATGIQANNVCGEQWASKAIALERGVCVHWAPKNAASWFIPKAVSLAAKEKGWRVFYAYSDPEAGEVGTVYQACNWLYLGQGPGHGPTRQRWTRPDGVQVSSRALRYRGLTTKQALSQGWKKELVASRGKYVWFEGTSKQKRVLRRALRFPVQPYPKR